MSNLTEWTFMRLCSRPTTHYIRIGISSIGRDIAAFIVCSNLAVSKKHAVVATGQNKPVYIRDNNTTNGTFINDERVPPGRFCLLLEDDIVTFGKPKSMMVDLNNEYCFKLIKNKKIVYESPEYIRAKKDQLQELLERELQEIHNIDPNLSQLNMFKDITAQPNPDAQKVLDEMTNRVFGKERQIKLRVFSQRSLECGDAGETNNIEAPTERTELQESHDIAEQISEDMNKRVQQKSIEIPAETVQQKSKEDGKLDDKLKELKSSEQKQKSECGINKPKEDNHKRKQEPNGVMGSNLQLTSKSTERVRLKSSGIKDLAETDRRKSSKSTDVRVQPKSTGTKNRKGSVEKVQLNSTETKRLKDLERVQPKPKGTKKDINERVLPISMGTKTLEGPVVPESMGTKTMEDFDDRIREQPKPKGTKKDIDERVLPISMGTKTLEGPVGPESMGTKTMEDFDDRIREQPKPKGTTKDIDERVFPISMGTKTLEGTVVPESGTKTMEDFDDRIREQPKLTRNTELERTDPRLKQKSTEKMEINKTNDIEQLSSPGQKILVKSMDRLKRKSVGQQQLEDTIERVRQKISAEYKIEVGRKRGRPKKLTKINKLAMTVEKAGLKSPNKNKLEKTNERGQRKSSIKKQPVESSTMAQQKQVGKTTQQKPFAEKETNKSNKRVSQQLKESNKKIKVIQEEIEPKITTSRKEILEKAKTVPSTKKKLESFNVENTVFKTPDVNLTKNKHVTFPGCDNLETNNLGKRQRSKSVYGSVVSEVEKKIPKRRQTIFIESLPPRRSPRTRSKTARLISAESKSPVTESSPAPTPKKSIPKSPGTATDTSELNDGAPSNNAERITLTLRKRSYSLYSVVPDINKSIADLPVSRSVPPTPDPGCKMKFYDALEPYNSFERRSSIAPIIMQRPPITSESLHNRKLNNVHKLERSHSIIGYVDERCRTQLPRSRLIMGSMCTAESTRVASSNTSSHMVPNEHFLPECHKTFLAHVIRWNPSWLEEYMRHDDTLPPIFHESKNDIPVMLYTYRNFEAYSDTIISLIILEVWEAAFNAYKAMRSNSEKLNFIMCGQPPKAFVGTKITKITLKSRDKSIVPSRMGNGMMLLVNFPEIPKCINRWFIGLVDDFEYRLVAGSKGTKELIVTMYVRLDPQLIERAQSQSLVHVKPLTLIKNELSMVRAVHSLQMSELKNMIVSPKEIFFKKFQSLSPLQWKHQLNASQLRAVTQCICAISSNMPTIQIIQGPPGTGKSRVIVSIVMEYLQRTFKSHRGKVLICAQTNIAIDEIVKRLLECRLTCERKFSVVRVGRCERMQPHSLEVSSTTLAKKFEHNPDIRHQIKLLRMNIDKFAIKRAAAGPQGAYSTVQHAHYTKKLDDLLTHSSSPGNLFNEELCVIEKADVIATTLQGCSQKKLQVLRNKVAFCIVDEAAKATEPEILIPLALGVKSLHLVGDHQQLPAFVSSHHAKRKGLGESLFTRLIHCCECWEHACLVPLHVQYRMHPDIAHFPNLAFYEGKLKNGLDPTPLPRVLPPYRVLYLKGNTKDQDESGVNSEEANTVAKLSLAIDSYIRSEKLNLSFCVLTPYSGQKDAILTHLRRCDARNEIEVSTVDSFQGQERDVVVISCARSSGTGFLDDPGRMSVLLTRARRSCVICCNPDALKIQSLWASLMEDADSRLMSRSLPRKIPQYSNEEDNRKKFLQYLL